MTIAYKPPANYGEVCQEIAQMVDILSTQDVKRLRRLGMLVECLSKPEFVRTVVSALRSECETNEAIRCGVWALYDLEAWA